MLKSTAFWKASIRLSAKKPFRFAGRSEAKTISKVSLTLSIKEYRISGDSTIEGDLSDEALSKYDELYEKVVEAVAETSEELLEKFFGGEELTQDELNDGLRTGVLNGDIIPIVFGSAVKNVCVHELLNMMSTLLPSPLDAKPKPASTLKPATKSPAFRTKTCRSRVMSSRPLLTRSLAP